MEADVKVWVDDGLVDARDAFVSVFDRGFRTGEGVFESLRTYGTHPFRLDAHLQRAAAGADVLGFELPSNDDLERAIAAVIGANHEDQDLGVRLTVTPGRLDPGSPFPGRAIGGPTVVVTTQPVHQDPGIYAQGVSAAVVPWGREVPHVKAVSYLAATLARRQAAAQGADEALLTDPRGWILEGSYSNVFAVVQGTLVTPPVEVGILAGVTRAVTLEVASQEGLPVEERPLTVQELADADEAFLTSTTRELVPLVRLAGRMIGNGVPGSVTSLLREGYRAEVRREIELAGD